MPTLPPSPEGSDASLEWRPTPLVRASIWLHAGTAAAMVACPSTWAEGATLLAANHAVLACGMHPRSALLGKNLVRLPMAAAQRGFVALTFDDGPDPEATPRVLDLLDLAGAQATFFVIGCRAQKHPALAREILRRGHAIGNHTQRHPLGFACWPPASMRREIEEAQRAIGDVCGQAPTLFRPPAGLRSPLLDPVLVASGLSLVSWSRRGYDGVVGRAGLVLRHMARGLAAGDILLLHDGRSARARHGGPVVLDVLPRLLERLRDLGLRSVPLSAAAASLKACETIEPAKASPLESLEDLLRNRG